MRTDDAEIDFDLDEAAPGGLWDGGDSSVPGGVNWSEPPASAGGQTAASEASAVVTPNATHANARHAGGTGVGKQDACAPVAEGEPPASEGGTLDSKEEPPASAGGTLDPLPESRSKQSDDENTAFNNL